MSVIYTTYLSKKVALLNVVATVLIVVLHALPPLRYGYPLDRTMPLYYLLSIVCQFGVPMFFFLSGYLFYSRCDSFVCVREKLIRRIKTLLVPYLLWNALFVFLFFIMTRVDAVNGVMNMGKVINSARDVVVGVFDARFTPLWFVKILIYYTLLAPILFFCLNRKMLFAVLLFGSMVIAMLCSCEKYDNILLWLPVYLSGCSVGFYKPEIPKRPLLVATLCGALVCLIPLIYFGLISLTPLRLVGSIAIWFLVDWLWKSQIEEHFVVRKWMTYTFFIYCTHYFVLNILQKLSLLAFGAGSTAMFLTFIITSFAAIALLVLVARALSNYKVYRLLTGGR